MTAPTPITRLKRRTRWQAVLGISLLLVAGAVAWFLTSDSFRELVRRRVVQRIEEASGGRAELKVFRWNLSQMEFEADGLSIHGKEKSNEPPFAQCGRIYARIKVVSFFRREIDLQFLSVTQPSINIIVYPDGTTNQPTPRTKREGASPVEPLFEAAVGKLELQQGTVTINEQRVPIDIDANDVNVGMSYDASAKRFDGTLHIGRSELRFKDWRPLPIHADTSFSLFENRARINSLHVASGKSHLDASGDVHDFLVPLVELEYKAHLEMNEISSAARLQNISGGAIDLNGQGRGGLEHFASAGNAQVRGLLYRDSTVHDVSVGGTAQYSADEKRIVLSKIAGQIWQGTVTGEAEIQGWLQAKSNPPTGNAQLSLQGVHLQPFAEALSSKKLPFKDLHLAGEASGTVGLAWKGMPGEGTAKLNIKVDPSPTQSEKELPITAMLRGVYIGKSETLQLDSSEVTTPNSEITASGILGSDKAQLQVAFNTQKITEFQPLVEAISGPDSPVLLNGAAKFTGTISGRFRAPTIVGHVEVHDFSTVFPETSAQKSLRVVRWNSLDGELRYSPDQLSLSRSTLHRGNAVVTFDGSSTLDTGKFFESSNITLRAQVRNADVSDLQSLAEYNYPVKGRLDGTIQISGPKTALVGDAHIQLSDALAWGEPIRSAAVDLRFQGDDVRGRNLAVTAPAGQVVGSGSYNRSSERFGFELRGTGLRLEQLHILQEKRIDVRGLASFKASGQGTPKQPVVDANIELRNLALGGDPVGDLTLEAETAGENLRLKGRSNFLNASLGLDGTVHMRDDFPGHLVVDFKNLDLDPLLRGYLKQFHFTSHALAAGHFQFDGPIRRPELLSAQGDVYSFTAGLENVKVANEGPIHFTLNRHVIGVENLHLVGEGTNFNAAGTVSLSGARELNVRANGNVNLQILQSFSPEYAASGMTSLDMRVTGTMQQPHLRGRINIQDGAISYVDLPNGLSGINGSLIFTEDRLQVQNLTAHSGGGELVLGGFIAYSHELAFNLTARGKDIRLRYPPGISSSGDANLTLAGTPKSALLSGEITVTRFGLNPRFDFASYLARSKQAATPVKADSPLNGLRMDVHVVSTPELQVETSLAKVTGNVDIHLRGTGAKPVVLGRVNIIEGDLTFNSTTYHLERGEISFTNPTFIEPILDIEATAHVRDYDITLGFHGPADHPSTNYRSDPPLPTADIIALLALGRTREDSAQAQMYNPQQTTITDSASNELLSQALNATVSSRVQKLFGVSRIKIDPQVGGPDNNTNARLTIEQQVSNKVTLTYITNLSQSSQQIIQMEYNISRDLSILAIRDQTGVVSFDVRIRQRKK